MDFVKFMERINDDRLPTEAQFAEIKGKEVTYAFSVNAYRVRGEYRHIGTGVEHKRAAEITASILQQLFPEFNVRVEPGVLGEGLVQVSYTPKSEEEFETIRTYLERTPTDGEMPKKGQTFFGYD